MTNPTSNFGWQMPTPTDLVTDLPADFEVFGQAVDTSMADLKGGTTGQILSKATNADMDFTWITNDVGDITAVTVSSPLTGGGTSGSVSVGILSGTTSNLGAVQLSDSTSSTSTTLAATANAVKTTYDLANTANTAAGAAQTTANAAIPKSTVTTAGDVIYATGSAAVTRLGIGSTGQVLTVNGGAPSWAAGNTGRGLMAYVTSTTSVSASASTETVALTTPSFTAVTGRLYKITYYEPQVPLTQNANPTTARIRLTNTAGAQYQAGVATNASATAGFNTSMNLSITTALTAGSTVIVATLYFQGLGQTATRGGGQAGVLVVEDIGLA